ncbi:hypothetical protein MiSe_03290 [Microseira wollei NIES-4236]|uniref:Secreted protein n=1 Tax=Microseira wollei NIES-4236 TaxID=2530354 RepID=A0AAV3X5V5_9CYAN|nr:hypothetical protein MiSe_03290 [Microseira wollei NIES-4236]
MSCAFVCVAAALMLPLHKQAKRLYLTHLQSAVLSYILPPFNSRKPARFYHLHVNSQCRNAPSHFSRYASAHFTDVAGFENKAF